LAAFGVARFAYFVLSKPNAGGGELISTYPQAWLDCYADQNYESIDPVIQGVRTRDAAFAWDDTPPNPSPLRRQLFDEALQFGICCGFAIPFREHCQPIAAMTLVAGEPLRSFRRSLEVSRRTLQLMAVIVHLRARNILRGDHVIAGIRLTPRELECLQWAARGKSAWDIGQILGITRRTASFHLDNAKAKLGVRTICQAVARIAAGGL
jgi:DNA-binding CsgD family transcriptional regulator